MVSARPIISYRFWRSVHGLRHLDNSFQHHRQLLVRFGVHAQVIRAFFGVQALVLLAHFAEQAKCMVSGSSHWLTRRFARQARVSPRPTSAPASGSFPQAPPRTSPPVAGSRKMPALARWSAGSG
jgi:hypothetical protein